MKSAIYIEDGRTQVVLTPDTDLEKMALAAIERSPKELNTYRGSFYECQGGWTRSGTSGDSLIFVVDTKR